MARRKQPSDSSLGNIGGGPNVRRRACSRALVALLPLVLVAAAASSGNAARSAVPLDLREDEVRVRETALGDLIADAIRAAASADAAIIPAMAFRPREIPAGEVTVDMILAALILPDETLAVIELTGSQLLQALEKSVAIYPRKNSGFLQVSGIEIAFDASKPSGKRVTSAKVGDKPLLPEATYRVATTDSLGSGAGGYWRIWRKEQVTPRANLSIAKAIEALLARNNELDYRKLRRIAASG